MTNSSEGPTTVGKVILTGLAGILGWQAIGPKWRDRVWGFLDSLAEAAAMEAQRKQVLEEVERRRSMLTPLPMIDATPIQGFTPNPPKDGLGDSP